MRFSFKRYKSITITNPLRENIDESNRKPYKTWVNKGNESYNRSMKWWLQDNDIEMYLGHNEGKSFDAEIFTRTLKSNILQK